MATLEADVKARVPNQTLVELTRSDPSATTIDDTILSNAVVDVQADFKTYGGITYDAANAQHVSEAIMGVCYRLLAFKFEANGTARYGEWQERIHKTLRIVTAQDRIMPKSSSRLTPATEAPGGTVERPLFDVEERFADLIPGGRGKRSTDFPGGSGL